MMKIRVYPRHFSIFKNCVLILFFTTLSLASYSQWPALSTPNVAISTSSGNEHNYWACTDGDDGSITVWEDDRTGDQDIYAQRIDKEANVLWTVGGLPISVVAGHNHGPMLVEDGSGGAIMAWKDERSGKDIYAQKVNTFGVVQWTANGIPICAEGSDQDKVYIVGDGAGGAIMAWVDKRNGNEDIYAQRVNSAGVVQWAVNGVAITTATDKQKDICMAADGVGGAVITWTDERTDKDIFVQRIDAAGVVQYAVNGLAITALGSEQEKPDITADGFGDFIIGWQDKRSGDKDIWVQQISLAGVVSWAANGVLVSAASSDQTEIDMVEDGVGGAFMAWTDKRTGSEDIYSQRVNDAGVMQWAANGVVVSDAADTQKKVHMAIVNGSKTLMTWEDKRNGDEDIYVQALDSNGSAILLANGLAASTASGKQSKPFIFHTGGDNWISVWKDERNGNKDLYAQGYNPTILGPLPVELISFEANINDDKVDIKWVTASEINNDYFTIERSIDGKDWAEIMTVNGAGNSNQLREYFDIDYDPIKGISYYRLKQTDFDGKYEFFNIVPVKYEGDNSGGGTISLFPSPVRGGEIVNIEFSNIFEEELLVVLRDIKGREFYSKMVINIEDGKLIGVPIDIEIPRGIYLITATSENQMYSQKLIVK
ncbi:MAG: hypothetical protein COB15_11780 [Flavobacteriales bacterium]|nr:MAG: hypothetical protein COB15_11780 [Flavobacteriales bacterium]